MQLEAEEHLLLVREVADHAAQRRRQLFDQRGRGEDPIILGDLGILEHVDDLEPVPAAQLLLADPAEVGDRDLRPGIGAGDVELEDEFRQSVLPGRDARVDRCVAVERPGVG
jgi:hypothetical protein